MFYVLRIIIVSIANVHKVSSLISDLWTLQVDTSRLVKAWKRNRIWPIKQDLTQSTVLWITSVRRKKAHGHNKFSKALFLFMLSLFSPLSLSSMLLSHSSILFVSLTAMMKYFILLTFWDIIYLCFSYLNSLDHSFPYKEWPSHRTFTNCFLLTESRKNTDPNPKALRASWQVVQQMM